jgi:demethylmenaquinone methyltransferase/2-methoxy-6-polyprenyl-1,4-benzoquinol methylase
MRDDPVPNVQGPQSEAQIATMFDRIAPRYDLLNTLLSARQDRRWRDRLARLVPYRPRGRYLDVATGTGDVILTSALRRPEYDAFVGVDISPEMLHLARAKAKQRGLGERLVFQPMSAERLAFEDASFDCVSISFGLRNVVDKEAALREFHRVLRPGGALLILEFFLPRRGLGAWLFQLYFHRILPAIGALLSDRAAYTYLPQSVGSFYSGDKLREVLYDRGFTIETQVSFLFGATRLYKAVKL